MGGIKKRKAQKRLAVRLKAYEAGINKVMLRFREGYHRPGSNKK